MTGNAWCTFYSVVGNTLFFNDTGRRKEFILVEFNKKERMNKNKNSSRW